MIIIEAIDIEVINTVDPQGRGRSTIIIEVIDVEAINTVDPGGEDWWSLQRGSTVNFHMENSKDFLLIFLHVCIKTVYIHHNARFSLKKMYTNLSFSVDS